MTKKLAILLLFAIACSREQATNMKNTTTAAAGKVASKVRDAFDVSVPLGTRDKAEDRERQRFDQQWRRLQSFLKKSAQPLVPQPSQPAFPIQFVKRTKETLKNLDPSAINTAPSPSRRRRSRTIRMENAGLSRSQSHGCVRLTNWDAAELEHRVSEGILVSFLDSRKQDAPKIAGK
jgi:hypothetical protein